VADNGRTRFEPSFAQIDPSKNQEFDVESHDLPSLLFKYLDEFLYRFSVDGLVCRAATILEFDRTAHKIRVRGEGESFDMSKYVASEL
jgi:SHS2 domain-containing protein